MCMHRSWSGATQALVGACVAIGPDHPGIWEWEQGVNE